jgi:UDP-N-acetylglucosamine 4,6-dehydratase
MLKGKTVLVTGATGTFGQAFTRYALNHDVAKLRLLSRDEAKQAAAAETLTDPRIRWLLGDVRDRDRLDMAMRGCDLVIHAAALKRIEKCEYDPLEAIHTNIEGTANVVRVAVQHQVRLIFLSTDKACNPITHYGVTKAAAEKIVLHGNAYLGGPPLFSVVRYGNVANSRGSVIPLWQRLAREGKRLPVTDVRSTRFWITVEQAVLFVANTLAMPGGRLYVPGFMPSYKIVDLALAIQGANGPPFTITGPRGVEKVHEDLVAAHETVVGMIGPYRSDMNTKWLDAKALLVALEGL